MAIEFDPKIDSKGARNVGLSAISILIVIRGRSILIKPIDSMKILIERVCFIVSRLPRARPRIWNANRLRDAAVGKQSGLTK